MAPGCLVILAALFGGCATSSKSQPTTDASPLSPKKLAIRNNAASLLYDLLGDEKNLSKLFFLKGGRPELKSLVKIISSAAGAGEKKLEELAKKDSSLDLKVANLPPGEQATRDAISKTKEHDLLHSSGADLELNLLLTQADALGYGTHLAKIAAENSERGEQVQEFNALASTLDGLHQQVISLLRNPPK